MLETLFPMLAREHDRARRLALLAIDMAITEMPGESVLGGVANLTIDPLGEIDVCVASTDAKSAQMVRDALKESRVVFRSLDTGDYTCGLVGCIGATEYLLMFGDDDDKLHIEINTNPKARARALGLLP